MRDELTEAIREANALDDEIELLWRTRDEDLELDAIADAYDNLAAAAEAIANHASRLQEYVLGVIEARTKAEDAAVYADELLGEVV